MIQAFSRSQLARCLRSADFHRYKALAISGYVRDLLLNSAHQRAQSGFGDSFHLIKQRVKGKTTYSAQGLDYKLVLRLCAEYLCQETETKPKSRSRIIREISQFLRQGCPYRIYKLDIASFFESCDRQLLLQAIESTSLAQHPKNLINNLFKHLDKSGFPGLPRGLEISPPLAELLLQEFDRSMLTNNEVQYYARFVDDIFIITNGNENKLEFLKHIRKLLPPGLHLNHNKKNIENVPKRSSAASGDIEVTKFTYLGYMLSVHDTKVPENKKIHALRSVKIDMAPQKASKYERKIHRAFLAFAKDRDFELLRQRLVFLASNRNYNRKSGKKAFPVGIYYNFGEITLPSESLKKIDKTLRAIVTGKRKRLAKSKVPQFNALQKMQLLSISFEHGHIERSFRRYNPEALKKMTSIWRE